MRILAVGDSYMSPVYFADAFAPLRPAHEVEIMQIDADRPFTPTSESEQKLREYQGSPDELIERMPGTEVLVVQGAPVTDAVLDASAELRLVCCARGGPVNVDADAVTARGLPLINTPGKNADAVADLTIAFMVMLARGVPAAGRFLAEGQQLRNNWDGVRFLGSDIRGQTLGLIGYGQVGRRVAERAQAFGAIVLVFDPYAAPGGPVERVDHFEELLARSTYVSLHARATAETENMIDAKALARMRSGACLINTARETLVDEHALDQALASGHLRGAALDVFQPLEQPGRHVHPLLRHENVVLTPHIGGATHETLLRGAEMIAAEISRFDAGEPLTNRVNQPAAA
jgi:D-3-phosphoglycerate dehydrogenase / 2-oxoglutarate reductase